MMMLKKSFFACFLIFLLAAGMIGSASAEVTLTVGNNWNWSDQTVQIPVLVDNPAKIAGAAFTITYDDDNLTLDSIESTFFDTFANQWAELESAPVPYPPSSVEVDSVVYYKPLLTSTATAGTRVAAARCMPAAGGGETSIFTLTFSLNSGAEAVTYDVDITAMVLNNVAAGYDPAGETIPMIIGSELSISDPTDPDAYPVLLDPNATPAIGSVISGTVTFKTDGDNDGMEDSWEVDHFGSTGAKDGTDDSDQDGYFDLQEFLNDTDPYEQDAPGGEGYDPATDDLSISGNVISNNENAWVSLIIEGEIVDVINVQTIPDGDFSFELTSDPEADEYTLTAVDNDTYCEITVAGTFLPIVDADIDLTTGTDLVQLTLDDTVEYEETEYTDGSDLIFLITAQGGTGSVTDFPNGLILTLPFNLGQVSSGDFEFGDVTIYHADTSAELLAGSGTAVSLEDILDVDYTGNGQTGWVTFRVYSLSAFGIGIKPDNSGGGGGGGGGGCFISNVAKKYEMALPAAMLIVTGFGLAFYRVIRFGRNG